MRLVHLSDLHLGFRQFPRQTTDGVNQREADVAATCARAVSQIITCEPDVVLVGGDVFHHVRPSNSAILSGFALFARLRASLPNALIIMIAGNHDLPRTADAGCILQLFRELNIHVVTSQTERINDPARDLSVLAVPFAPPSANANGDALTQRHYEADPLTQFNVLLLHDDVRGVIPDTAQLGDRLHAPIDPIDLERSAWDYVGLGHYHVYRSIKLTYAATGRDIPCYYSGSLEYTSTNPWVEVREEAQRNGMPTGQGKGFIEHNLVTGEHRFHSVTPGRRLIDLPPLDAAGKTANELDALIAAAISHAGDSLDNAIVRLVVRDVMRHVVRTLDYAPLRDVRKRTLHFQLDTRKPEAAARAAGTGAPGRRATLRDRLVDRLQQRPLAPGLDRDRLVQLGLTYLTRAEDAATAALPVAEV